MSSSNMSSPHRGYLAFPAGFSMTPEQKVKNMKDYLSPNDDTPTKANLLGRDSDISSEEGVSTENLEKAWKDRLNAEARRRRLLDEREREEAMLGEKEWVRSGGILRDANGRRDHERTAEIRKIVEKEEAEKRALARWAAYECAWGKLNVSSEPVTFESMPWPLVQKPQTTNDLRDPSAIAQFLFETIGLDESAVTRKERLRSSLLRWHPDKLGGLLARVVETDLPTVKDGIDAVFMSVKNLQDMEKADRG